jgi:hypothetical protein
MMMKYLKPMMPAIPQMNDITPKHTYNGIIVLVYTNTEFCKRREIIKPNHTPMLKYPNRGKVIKKNP